MEIRLSLIACVWSHAVLFAVSNSLSTHRTNLRLLGLILTRLLQVSSKRVSLLLNPSVLSRTTFYYLMTQLSFWPSNGSLAIRRRLWVVMFEKCLPSSKIVHRKKHKTIRSTSTRVIRFSVIVFFYFVLIENQSPWWPAHFFWFDFFFGGRVVTANLFVCFFLAALCPRSFITIHLIWTFQSTLFLTLLFEFSTLPDCSLV